jgi:hypothetical protein
MDAPVTIAVGMVVLPSSILGGLVAAESKDSMIYLKRRSDS